ncbi:hypothetical protein [Pseudalkalibacillus caeni]|uniref:Uncharacterized protein n=1 Tax=Exobacillus caeni TaxID=2574798 RepID=A0A5R9EZP8_9BACL|nr:hypothetical protein [Pseudalkalibacillus caeni]TLS36271.1 hypothetical protein FCL54_16695 [Pseudalkalibacillus caeni]
MNNKQVLGVYDSSEELINDFSNNNNIENNADSFEILGEDREAVADVSGKLGIGKEPFMETDSQKEDAVNEVMSALEGNTETPVKETLVNKGLSQDQAKDCALDLQDGKLVVLGNPDDSNDGTANFDNRHNVGMNNNAGTGYPESDYDIADNNYNRGNAPGTAQYSDSDSSNVGRQNMEDDQLHIKEDNMYLNDDSSLFQDTSKSRRPNSSVDKNIFRDRLDE